MIEMMIERWSQRDGSEEWLWSIWRDGGRERMDGPYDSPESAETGGARRLPSLARLRTGQRHGSLMRLRGADVRRNLAAERTRAGRNGSLDRRHGDGSVAAAAGREALREGGDVAEDDHGGLHRGRLTARERARRRRFPASPHAARPLPRWSRWPAFSNGEGDWRIATIGV